MEQANVLIFHRAIKSLISIQLKHVTMERCSANVVPHVQNVAMRTIFSQRVWRLVLTAATVRLVLFRVAVGVCLKTSVLADMTTMIIQVGAQ